MHWVLIPSHCITNPRTIRSLFKNALYFYYYLHCIFRVLFRSFPFSFGNNKARWRLLLLWDELINNSISDLPRYIFYRYRIGDSAGDRLTSCWSIPKWVKPNLSYLFYYYLICLIMCLNWGVWVFAKDESYTRIKLHLRIGRAV